MSRFPKRGDVYWINLDPTIGTEIKKRRPCVIVSNNIGNELSSRVIVAPITSNTTHVYQFEVEVHINSKSGKILLDQIRCVDKIRLEKKIVSLSIDVLEDIDRALKIVLDI